MDYRGLMILRAARQTGVLDAVLLHAGTPEAVAEEAGVTEESARVVLEAMVELGFLERVGEAFEATNRALGFFAKTDVRSIGTTPHDLDCLERWLSFPETMRTGEKPETPDEWTTNYVGAMAAIDDATVRASVTAAVHATPDAETVLDVGGGPGVFAQEFARRGRDVTLLDHPDVLERARPHLEPTPVELVAGDATDSLPTRSSGFDLVFCSRFAHALGPDQNRALLDNAFDALAPGGAVVHVDWVRGRSANAALLGAHMFVQTDHGDTYTEPQFRTWLTDAGFESFDCRSVPGTDMHAVIGHRPLD
jgi:SAM-dependent methyltransferase